MRQVVKTPLPNHSALWSQFQHGDFIDGYAVTTPLSPSEALKVALNLPGWANLLMTMRNLIVKPLGIKTDAISSDSSLFPVVHEAENEIIVGADDNHLNFRISILKNKDRIHMATLVHRHNLMGRLYLAFVMPFHIIIVRNAMRKIAQATIH